MIIEVVNPIECRMKALEARAVQQPLSYTKVFYKKGRFGQQNRKTYKKQCFHHKEDNYWYFYRGYLDRVCQFLDSRRIEYNLKGENQFGINPMVPKLPGITFRPDQLDLIHNAIASEQQNGIIQSATGTGKTILQLGIISCFPAHRVLLLGHTVGIINQTVEEAYKFGFEGIQQIGGGVQYTGHMDGAIVVSTMQSFGKIDPEDWMDKFPVVIIDEAHHVSTFEGTYGRILSKLLAPVRLGFTATLPEAEEARMAIEGLLGPVLGELSINEAVDKGILAKPIIKLVKVPYNQNIRDLKRYADVYDEGIVQNNRRNSMIVDITLNHLEKDDSILIFVNRLEHGEYLESMFAVNGVTVPFIRGSMSAVERENHKESLIQKRRKVAIATTAWKEGINIPSLDVVINAGGGKSEIPVFQTIGRGLRRTDEKDQVTIYDFFDSSHPFLISHFGERVTLYFDQNWL